MAEELIQAFGGDGECWLYLSEKEIQETSFQEMQVQKGGEIPDKAVIVEYLRSARVHLFLFSDEEELCPYCGVFRYWPSKVRSDGRWHWSDRLPHLMEEHSVRIPQIFVEHIRETLKHRTNEKEIKGPSSN